MIFFYFALSSFYFVWATRLIAGVFDFIVGSNRRKPFILCLITETFLEGGILIIQT